MRISVGMESRTIDPMKIEADAYLPTEHGNFRVRVMVDEKGFEHAVFSVGLDSTDRTPLVSIECIVSSVL